jgi:hypothetical protein
VAIRPNRPVLVTAFAGTFEPTVVSTYTHWACSMCGADGATRTPPLAPPPGGGQLLTGHPLLEAPGSSVNLASAFPLDFSVAAGLGMLSGTPRVRVVGGLSGIGGMAAFGVGFATGGSGGMFSIHATYSVSAFLDVLTFAPILWASTEARDIDGNVSRHREWIIDPGLGVTFAAALPPGIPTIAPPGGASAGSPEVTYTDRLDPTAMFGGAGVALHELRATDGAGRRWDVIVQDVDGPTGPVTLQLPDLSAIGVAGLATGAWSVRAEDFLVFSPTMAGAGDFVLEERFRQAVASARASAVTFTVN